MSKMNLRSYYVLQLPGSQGYSKSCQSKVEMSAFPKSTWRSQPSEIAPEQSCHSPHHSAPRIAAWCRQGRLSKRRRAALTAGRDAIPLGPEGNGKCDAIRE